MKALPVLLLLSLLWVVRARYTDFTAYTPTAHTENTTYDARNWILETTVFAQNQWQTQPYVANGYHGSRLVAEGVGYWRIHNETGTTWPINGWPLDNPRQTVATISGFWNSQRNTTRTNFPELLEEGWESVISGIPTWTSFVVATGDGKYAYAPGVDNATVEEYYQSMSLRDGTVTTRVKWRPVQGGEVFDIGFTVVAHRRRVNLGMMKVDVRVSGDATVVLTDVLDGAGAQRTIPGEKKYEGAGDAIWTEVHPAGLPGESAVEYSVLDVKCGGGQRGVRVNAEARPWVSSNSSTIAQEITVEAKKDRTITVYKYVGIASTGAFPDPGKTARKAATEAKKIGWTKLMAEHRKTWNEFWEESDIEIPGPKSLESMQIAFRASIFHLLSNVRSADEGPGIGDNSISVGGLASDSYAGLVFWDADLWMLPGLLVLYPKHAEAINNYRYRLLHQAMENAKKYELPGALYPWTSARFGNCTATGPCVDYQYHLNTDIALVHWHQFLTSGDNNWFKAKGWPIIKAVADMWTGKVEKSDKSGEDGLMRGMYTVKNMTDPDEYANHIDNGAFTNAGVKVIMGIAQQAAKFAGYTAPSKWADIEKNMFIPYNWEAGIIPEYASMNGSVQIKQADVVLINYPLEFRLNESQALNDLDFYARAQSPDGPAMTWAMFANGALDLSPHGCASWTYSVYASQPYLREPYYQFSEQIVDDIYLNGNTNPAFTFLTGHGGFLQIPTHGYTGYRPRLEAFYLDPSIPPQLTNGIKIKGMKHQGASFDVHITLTNTTISRRPSPQGHRSPAKVRIASRNPQAGDYTLFPGQSLTVPTRRPDLNGTDIPGNLAECKPSYSTTAYVPGQFPLAGVDGSNHTNWRPSTPLPSSLIVDLLAPTSFSKLALNWARWPPTAFSVHSKGESQDDWTSVHEQHHVEISDPWKKDQALVVRRTAGNQTNVELQNPVVARWVRLTVQGDREGKGHGATVAQFAVL